MGLMTDAQCPVPRVLYVIPSAKSSLLLIDALYLVLDARRLVPCA